MKYIKKHWRSFITSVVFLASLVSIKQQLIEKTLSPYTAGIYLIGMSAIIIRMWTKKEVEWTEKNKNY